ncbi:hypothetical protein B0H14DRAFT_3535231 [Mycena olivaceomarginata]|nr:hypothetical protein B0H14DRAFT_3535231 [Mycena olivaceomarginata]
MRTLFAVNQWLCNIFSLAPPTISRPPLAQYFPFSCDASAGRLLPSTTPLSARFSTDFAVNPSAESITHFEWLRTSALAASVSGAFLSPISLPRRLRNVFACMGAIEAGSALTVAEAPALKATAVLRNFRGFRRRAPRMGTAWGCAHGCEAAASLPASGGTSCAFPTHFLRATERGPTPLRRERARTFVRTHSPNHSCRPEPHSCSALNLVSAVPAAHPFRRAGRCAGSTSLPAPACRPTPALEQGGGGVAERGPLPTAPSWCPTPPLEQGSGAGGGGREGGIPVAGGRTRAPRQPSSLRPPARLPARLAAREPLISKMRARGFSMRMVGGIPAGREGWRRSWAYGITRIAARAPDFENAGGNGGWKRRAGHVGTKIWHAGGIEVTQQGGRGGAERGRTGSTRLAARRAPDFENAGGNGGWKRRAGRVRAKI